MRIFENYYVILRPVKSNEIYLHFIELINVNKSLIKLIINYFLYDNSFSARKKETIKTPLNWNTNNKGNGLKMESKCFYFLSTCVCAHRYILHIVCIIRNVSSRCEIYYFSQHKMTLPIWILALLIAIHVCLTYLNKRIIHFFFFIFFSISKTNKYVKWKMFTTHVVGFTKRISPRIKIVKWQHFRL